MVTNYGCVIAGNEEFRLYSYIIHSNINIKIKMYKKIIIYGPFGPTK